MRWSMAFCTCSRSTTGLRRARCGLLGPVGRLGEQVDHVDEPGGHLALVFDQARAVLDHAGDAVGGEGGQLALAGRRRPMKRA